VAHAFPDFQAWPRLFALAVGEGLKRQQALDWLDNLIEEGQGAEHACEREVEARDCLAGLRFCLRSRRADERKE
jgi:hypothetical protein